MSMKICPICEYPFRDGDDIVAVMVAKFKKLESDSTVAITHPERCVEIVHSECFDWQEYDDAGESDSE